MGGGLWHPPADHVHALRASIDERPRRWRRVLNDERFKRTFLAERMGKPRGSGRRRGGGGGSGKRLGEDDGRDDEHVDDQKAALKAFAEGNQSNALKTKPMVCQRLFFFFSLTCVGD